MGNPRGRRYRVAMLDERDDRRRANEAAAAGRTAWNAGDYESALRWFELDLELTRRAVAGHPEWVSELTAALANYGNAAQATEDFDTARDSFDEALELCRVAATDDDETALTDLSAALNDLGRFLRAREDFVSAARLFEEDLSLCRQIGEERGLTVALNQVAGEAKRLEDYARARTLYRESAERLRGLLVEQSPDPAIALMLGATLWHLSNVINPGGRRAVLDELLRLVEPYIESGVRPADFGRLWDAAREAWLDLSRPR